MITYFINSQGVTTRNYSEVEILGKKENDSPFFNYAVKDFENLRDELRLKGYLY